jgi:uncharacterized protein DUF6496
MPSRKASRKRGSRRYGPAASRSVARAMRRRKRGTLISGRGGKGGRVRSRKQAIAIGLSETRRKGAKVRDPEDGLLLGIVLAGNSFRTLAFVSGEDGLLFYLLC